MIQPPANINIHAAADFTLNKWPLFSAKILHNAPIFGDKVVKQSGRIMRNTQHAASAASFVIEELVSIFSIFNFQNGGAGHKRFKMKLAITFIILDFYQKCRDNVQFPLKNDAFVLKNGQLFCISR